jgi:hypothetical protein
VLGDREASTEFVGNSDSILPGRIAGHPLEFFDEVGLVIVVVIEVLFQNVIWQPSRPFPVERLKSKDPSQDLRRQAHVSLEEQVQVSPRVAGSPLQFSDGEATPGRP